MSRRRRITMTIALVVLGLTLGGVYFTRGVMEYLPFLQAKKGSWSGAYVARGIVDQRPWQTAATLAALAKSAEEKDLAREAERLADHEVDQAFSQSLRQASLEAPKLGARGTELQGRATELQKAVDGDERRVAELTRQAAAGQDGSSNDLELAKAQLELDKNELADAVDDLARGTGDQRVKLRQELTARKAAMKKYNDQAAQDEGQTAVSTAEQYNTLSHQIAAWWSHRERIRLIAQAADLARADVKALEGDQEQLKAKLDSGARTPSATPSVGGGQQDRLRTQQSILSILSNRLDSQQQLVSVYERWGRQVGIQDQIVKHLMLRSLAMIAGICVIMILAAWGLQTLVEKMVTDLRQRQAVRTIVSLAAQVAGLSLILLVIFGVPPQVTTILGLVTAGLTVVFQDFIIAFCGWFVLIGPNGIRVRDWVEIDGVGGEVVQLGLFRTWLLETGNWTANGHPTGRRVSFLNGYAIRGKYFNFSTVGQWMWDEIKVTIPPATKIHPLVEEIYKATVTATEADAEMAEAEWKRVTHETGSPQFSAMPSVNMRPAGNGVDIVVRYITRAGVRLQKRNQLFETIVNLMQVKPDDLNLAAKN